MATNQTEQARTLPQMMAELQELMGAPVQRFKSDMQAAQAITPVDPNILREAAQSGGALSTAQDFATSDAWAMTPEMFKMQMANRPDVGKQIGEVTTLSDAIFGRTNQRKAMEAIAQAQLGTSKDSLEAAGRMYEGGLNRASSEKIAADSNTSANKRAQMQIASQEKMQRERLALEERKLTALRDSFGSGGVPANMPIVDQKLAMQYGDKAFKYLDKDGKVMTGRSVDYWSNRLLEQVYKGAVQDGWVQRMPEGFTLSNGKTYKSAVFRRNPAGGSWYGVEKTPDGKVIETREPLLTAWHPAASGGGRSGGSASRQVPLYAQED